MDEQFIRGRVLRIREIAAEADPFIKRRLLNLAYNYERRLGQGPRPPIPMPAEQAEGSQSS